MNVLGGNTKGYLYDLFLQRESVFHSLKMVASITPESLSVISILYILDEAYNSSCGAAACTAAIKSRVCHPYNISFLQHDESFYEGGSI
jgi:hypothetical protein